MINTVFGFGRVPEREKNFAPLIGSSQEQQYSIALTLLVCSLIVIPVMLLAKPCFFRETADEEEVERNEIELAENNGV